MTPKTRVAAIQMISTDKLDHNLARAEALMRQAVADGCQLAVLPENFAIFGGSLFLATAQQEQVDKRVQTWLSQLARELNLVIVAGSFPVNFTGEGEVPNSRVRACCWVVDEQGTFLSRYDKIHLFDVEVGDAQGRYKESENIEPGETVVLTPTRSGIIGNSICYDLRFPELFQTMRAQGAEIFTVPAAFTAVTGAAHWEVLLRARAIENQCFVIGCGQGGRHNATRETYGHSMIIDPWGRILAKAELGEAVVMADLDFAELNAVRQRMPVFQHKKLV
ncbi:MAG TPA: carbon-nitrogen hydrolase family protein [Pseudomonadales bacterium]|nr:carbon-nitrogen hydrolase family protein [Pseudomonadales bacterium]